MLPESLKALLKPLARSLPNATIRPGPVLKPLYGTLFKAHWLSREALEWAERGLFATPAFLARCAVHGPDVLCDRLPYITGDVRIELKGNIRISGQLDIISPHRGNPLLRIGEGVFIGHGTGISVAERIEIGDFTSIGAGSSIADTEGHDAYNPGKPIWEVAASAADIAPVVIEDNVQIGKKVTILKGVRIGARSMIGANAVVRSNIPPDSVVMGNPARVVRRMDPETGAAKVSAPKAQKEAS